MARWRLAAPHYLNTTDKIEWEYVEEDLHASRAASATGGRRPGAGGGGGQRRVRYPVPLVLDPRDPADWNYPNDECIIVAQVANRAYPHDIIFLGDPTPDMIPLNAEAEAISASFSDRWIHPIESLPAEGFGQSMIADLEKMIQRAVQTSGETPEQAMKRAAAENRSFNDAIPREEFDSIKREMAELRARLAAAEAPDEPDETPLPLEEVVAKAPVAAGRRGIA